MYILECVDGSLYTGWTNDIEKKVAAHNTGERELLHAQPITGHTAVYGSVREPGRGDEARAGDQGDAADG